MLNFTKMNGAGNDFVMIDNRGGSFDFRADVIARLCNRHRGIGADGLITVEPPQQSGSHLRMRYFNADGGEAEMCGNGARCFSRFGARLLGVTDTIVFDTLAGVITARLIGDNIQLGMSQPHGLWLKTRLGVADESVDVHFINTGVPHAVVFREDLQGTDVKKLGAGLRYHTHFAPKGTNANFIKAREDGSLAIRTYERGVEDETLACGTGVVASALIHHLINSAPSPIAVQVKGGETMLVGFDCSGESFSNVTLTGPADFVFEGTISL